MSGCGLGQLETLQGVLQSADGVLVLFSLLYLFVVELFELLVVILQRLFMLYKLHNKTEVEDIGDIPFVCSSPQQLGQRGSPDVMCGTVVLIERISFRILPDIEFSLEDV